MHFAVLYGSVRPARQGIKAAKFVQNQLLARAHTVTLLDAMELNLPLLRAPYKYVEDPPAGMQRAHEVLDAADAIVVVGGEYNHSIPPGLKNLLDHYNVEYHGKAAGIVSYSSGPFGGVRVAPHYRAILGELGLYPCSIMFPISKVQDAFDDEGNDVTEGKAYEGRIARFLGELEWLTEATMRQREKGNPF